MAKRQQLDTLIDLATDRRDTAATKLGQLQTTQQKIQSQLDALLNYREEYQHKLNKKMAAGISSSMLQNYQQFINSLNTAINQQKDKLARQHQRVIQGKEHWRTRQRELKSYDILATRRQKLARKMSDRREQQQIDEFASRISSTHHQA